MLFRSPMRPDILMLSLASAISGITMRSVEAMLPELARTFSTSVSAAASVITAAERRSVAAEREAADRFVASYYGAREGDIVEGRIVGSAKSGLFVRLDDTLADGFVPRRSLPGGGFSSRMSHGGSRRGKTGKGSKGTKDYETGDRVSVRIVEADGVRGSLILEILDHERVRRP